MSLFRQAIIGTKVQNQLKTLRYRLFAIGSYITKNGNSKILKPALDMKRRKWIGGLWESTENLNRPKYFF
jgi:hypothetical protein